MNYLIDCGTHFFQGFDIVREKYGVDESWKCFCFEANPYTFSQSLTRYNELVSEGLDITYSNVAVYGSETKIAINCASDISLGLTSQKSSIVDSSEASDFLYLGITKSHSVKVNTVDFPQFLADNVTENDLVVVKMDIEGAEFNVLESLISRGNQGLIDDLYCEFHEKFFDSYDEYLQRKDQYVQALTDAGVMVEIWN